MIERFSVNELERDTTNMAAVFSVDRQPATGLCVKVLP